MKTILILLLALSAMACSADPRDWRSDDRRAASGDCKAIRKESGRTQWQCANGDTFWLEAYRHKDRQADWKLPKDCKPARPKDGPAMVYGVHYQDSDAQRYRECSDGQSFWVK